jgi:hypothetical protein
MGAELSVSEPGVLNAYLGDFSKTGAYQLGTSLGNFDCSVVVEDVLGAARNSEGS